MLQLCLLFCFVLKITDEHCNRVIQYERDLLISINFNFNILHPHQLLLKYVSSPLRICKEDARLAWDLLNSVYEQTDLVLFHPPHTLALSALRSCVSAPATKQAIDSYCRENDYHLVEIKL